jgi:hypothetical protein
MRRFWRNLMLATSTIRCTVVSRARKTTLQLLITRGRYMIRMSLTLFTFVFVQ